MSFSIRVLNKSEQPSTGEVLGEIKIGNFLENFLVTPVNCTLDEIESQWKKELGLLLSGSTVVALRTDPQFAWLVYRQGDKCLFQEQLLLSQNGHISSIDGSILRLPEYMDVTEDGNEISEWCAPLSDVSDFLGLTLHCRGTGYAGPSIQR